MKMTKEAKQAVREQYEKVWHDDVKMVDYCTKRTSGYIIIGGIMVTVDKPHIQTDFWFGEHTYDYDEVCDTCRAMSESEQYFIEQNLESFGAYNMLRGLNGIDKWGYEASFDAYIVDNHYGSQDDDCILGYVNILKLGNNPDEHFATREGIQNYRKLTDEERAELAEFLKGEVEKFQKRLKTYLKRYGLSKCHYGVYWADR